jgi:hypothetical protein
MHVSPGSPAPSATQPRSEETAQVIFQDGAQINLKGHHSFVFQFQIFNKMGAYISRCLAEICVRLCEINIGDFLFFFLFAVLEMEPRALQILRKHFPTELHSQALTLSFKKTNGCNLVLIQAFLVLFYQHRM